MMLNESPAERWPCCSHAVAVQALRRPQWANVLSGIWLSFAPLFFWTTSPAAYVNDTLVGTLVISLAVLVPPVPGVSSSP